MPLFIPCSPPGAQFQKPFSSASLSSSPSTSRECLAGNDDDGVFSSSSTAGTSQPLVDLWGNFALRLDSYRRLQLLVCLQRGALIVGKRLARRMSACGGRGANAPPPPMVPNRDGVRLDINELKAKFASRDNAVRVMAPNASGLSQRPPTPPKPAALSLPSPSTPKSPVGPAPPPPPPKPSVFKKNGTQSTHPKFKSCSPSGSLSHHQPPSTTNVAAVSRPVVEKVAGGTTYESTPSVKDTILMLERQGPLIFGNLHPGSVLRRRNSSTPCDVDCETPVADGGHRDEGEGEDAGGQATRTHRYSLTTSSSSSSSEMDYSLCGDDDQLTSSTAQLSINDDTGSNRRSSLTKADTLHTTVINELRDAGLFRKLNALGDHNKEDMMPRPVMSGSSAADGLPLELGRVRHAREKRGRQGCASDPVPPTIRIDSSFTTVATEPGSLSGPSGKSQFHIPMRPAPPGRQTRTPASSTNPTNSLLTTSSSRSGSVYSTESNYTAHTNGLPSQNGEDGETKRLRELRGVAQEFLHLQRTFVQLLHNIGIAYPSYLRYLEKQKGREKSLLHDDARGQPHVVVRIAGHLELILGFHRVLLAEFEERLVGWDAHRPDLAGVLREKADYLKICNTFLKEKPVLCQELQRALDESKELAYATKRFEDVVLNNPVHLNGGAVDGDSASSTTGDTSLPPQLLSPESRLRSGSMTSLRGNISIVMHLDAVHQNVVRYRLLMERYRKYLSDSDHEAAVADEALNKLIQVSTTVNGFLADADANKKLLDLHRKLGGYFDLFAPGRRLLHDGECQRQTRKELKPRYLILFSDYLLVCRPLFERNPTADVFDQARLYRFPIETVRVKGNDHPDFDTEFILTSDMKSSIFVTKTKRERDLWVARISGARKEAKEKWKKRKSIHNMQLPSIRHHNDDDDYAEAEAGDAPSEQLNTVTTASTDLYCPPVLGEAASSGAGAQETVNGQQRKPASKRTQRHRHVAPLWIDDKKATKCLMKGCGKRFSLFNRRHHCRQCGWLICWKCVGNAPVKGENFSRVIVCAQCYYELVESFEAGELFPPEMLQTFNLHAVLIAASQLHAGAGPGHPDADAAASTSESNKRYRIEDTSLRVVLSSSRSGGEKRYMLPRDLFRPPINGALRKTKIPVREKNYEASGRVHVKDRKGKGEAMRWARLTKDMQLQFYEAEFDDNPVSSHIIVGYQLEVRQLDDEAQENGCDFGTNGGWLFELTHRNQIQTERKEDKVLFRVANEKSAERWTEALRRNLDLEGEGAAGDEV